MEQPRPRPAGSALANLRDLGGLPLAMGGSTRRGVLYRSDAPYSGDDPPAHVPEWPPATVLDLRHPRELMRGAHQWPQSTLVHPWPLFLDAAPENIRGGDIAGLYRHLLAAAADRLARAAALVVGAPRPTLVHCTAGKDRTGVVVAALLLAAGVQVEAVVADYMRTAEYMADVIRRMEMHSRVPRNALWLLAPEAAIREVVATLDSSSGGAASWLITRGVDRGDLERWIQAFVDDTENG